MFRTVLAELWRQWVPLGQLPHAELPTELTCYRDKAG